MTRFKGGDGVASLGGVVVGLFPLTALPASLVAIMFGLPPLRYKFAHPSLQAGVTGWCVLLFTIAIVGPPEKLLEHLLLYVGITCIAIAVLLKSVRFHRRNADFFSEEELDASEFDDRRTAESEH